MFYLKNRQECAYEAYSSALGLTFITRWAYTLTAFFTKCHVCKFYKRKWYA